MDLRGDGVDKFEIFMEKMNEGRPEVRDTIDMWKMVCVCPSCPSYNDCARDNKELAYCLVGKTQHCKIDEQGCICPDCPVTLELELKNTYYCARGSELQMRKM